MNEEKCAVPSCINSATTGIPFPGQEALKSEWLESLELVGYVPGPRSFVCLDHFGNGELHGQSAVGLKRVLEELPIPRISKQEHKTACRLCLNEVIEDIDIFDEVEDKLTIAMAIMQCIPLIKITSQDSLSKVICSTCLNLIKNYHTFRSKCLKIDTEQRQLNSVSKKRKLPTPSTSNKKSRTRDILKTEIDRKFDKVEAELMHAIEGKLTEEMKSAENIIIQVQSDDESEEFNPSTFQVGAEIVKLPPGIKVSVSDARIGSLDAKTITGICGYEFSLVDGFLFEHLLCKGEVRNLKCVVSKCHSTGEENVGFKDRAVVKHPHNHPPLSETEIKQQIVLHVLRRKMQIDKSLNFRNLYEEICKEDPEIQEIVPLKMVINRLCNQGSNPKSHIESFEQFFNLIEENDFQRFHFTHLNAQFYQERFLSSDGAHAVVFANPRKIRELSDSKIMYVDASFNIETKEKFNYHLVTILLWVKDSYYPILFALVDLKSQLIYKAIFDYLHDVLAPDLCPDEIVTDYEACLYYALGETYVDSHVGGSVFYYTQNLYKKICSLNLSRELEVNSCFRTIYHMILMLPLLPVNTMQDGLENIEIQAAEMGQSEHTKPIFEYVKAQWMSKVTPDLFCVHRLENRINENVIAPFKKLRDLLMLSKGKMQKQAVTILTVVEKLIELEAFLEVVYSVPSKKSFTRDLSSSQKKNVIRAWHFIETHPKININVFFNKVLGYIKCMENQLWIWGFYRYTGDSDDDLINSKNFSIISTNDETGEEQIDEPSEYEFNVYGEEVVMDVVIDAKDGFLVKEALPTQESETYSSYSVSSEESL